VLNITNIHNPSIELQLPPPEKANGTAVIVAAGGRQHNALGLARRGRNRQVAQRIGCRGIQ
jgi:hypothetical protein